MSGTMTADLLRAVWPKHTAKLAASAASSPWETARGWIKGRYTPSADTLLRMAQQNRELRAELLRLLGSFDDDVDQAGAGALAQAPGQVGGAAGGPAGPTPGLSGRGGR